MKNIYALLAFAAGVAFASCTSDNEDIINNADFGPKTFQVCTPSADATRALVNGIDTQNPQVNWEKTDEIYVWGVGKTAASTFKWDKAGAYQNYAYFTGNIDRTASQYFLMYPNQSDATFDGTKIITATIPVVQTPTLGSFDPKAAICTGATKGSDDKSVSILHACTFFKITLTKECNSVVVKAADNASWKMAGKVTIETSSSASKITSFTGSEGSEVSLKNSDGSSFAAGTYLIAVAPSTKFPGISVTVNYADGTKVEKSKSGETEFAAAYIYNLGTAK